MISKRSSTGRPISEALCWDMSMDVGACPVTWSNERKGGWLLFACEA